MADDEPTGRPSRPPAVSRRAARQPDEEELRAQLEEEMRKVRVEDVILQSVVSILNLTARRIAKDDERDLEQAQAGDRGDARARRPGARGAGGAGAPGALRAAARYAREASGERGGRRGASAARGRRRPSRHGGTRAATAAGLWTPPAHPAARSATPSRLPAASRGRSAPASLTGEADLTDFLTDYGVVVALGCAGAAVVYGAADHPAPARQVARQRADAGDLRRHPGGRQRLPDGASTRSSPGSAVVLASCC